MTQSSNDLKQSYILSPRVHKFTLEDEEKLIKTCLLCVRVKKERTRQNKNWESAYIDLFNCESRRNKKQKCKELDLKSFSQEIYGFCDRDSKDRKRQSGSAFVPSFLILISTFVRSSPRDKFISKLLNFFLPCLAVYFRSADVGKRQRLRDFFPSYNLTSADIVN